MKYENPICAEGLEIVDAIQKLVEAMEAMDEIERLQAYAAVKVFCADVEQRIKWMIEEGRAGQYAIEKIHEDVLFFAEKIAGISPMVGGDSVGVAIARINSTLDKPIRKFLATGSVE